MTDALCRAIYGRRGSGKTTLARKLIGPHQRVIVFDPIAEYAKGSDFRRCERLADVLAELRRSWRTGFRLAYVPAADHPRMLHGLADLIWTAQEPYHEGTDRRSLLLVVEEMNLGYPVSMQRRELYAMQRATLQGRHRGIEILGITQRPALVSTDFRGNVAETYVFPLSGATDIKAVLQIYGQEHADAVRALTPHSYLRFTDTGVTRGRNTSNKKSNL